MSGHRHGGRPGDPARPDAGRCRSVVLSSLLSLPATRKASRRTYNVSQGWISRLMARYREEGEAAFEPRSRRPHHSPNATAPATVDLVLRLRKRLTEQGHDPGADTIGWHLRHHRDTEVPRATIHRILVRHSAVCRIHRSDPSRPTCASRPISPTRPGSPTSPTTDSPSPTAHPAPMWRS